MAAGDKIPLHRQFTEEQIADYKARAIATLKKYDETGELPKSDESVNDILRAFDPWEFDTQRDADGSPGMYGGYGYRWLERDLEQLEAGVDDWLLTEAPAWARYSDINWANEGDVLLDVEHTSGSNYNVPGRTHRGEDRGDAFSFYLFRRDRIVDQHTAIEGPVLVGISQSHFAEETHVELSAFLAAIDGLRNYSASEAAGLNEQTKEGN